jgi:hypothetical protein
MLGFHPPLFYAIFSEHYALVINLLVDAGALLEDTPFNMTVLQMAIRRRRPLAVVYALIDRGAQMRPLEPEDDHYIIYWDCVRYYTARLQRRDRQRAFMATVLSMRSNNNKDLVRLFNDAIPHLYAVKAGVQKEERTERQVERIQQNLDAVRLVGK